MGLLTVFIFFSAALFLKSSDEPFTISFLGMNKAVARTEADAAFFPDTSYQFPVKGTLSKDTITTVSTFQNISLYWKPVEGALNREALVRYRMKGMHNWVQAQSLWFDERSADSLGNN